MHNQLVEKIIDLTIAIQQIPAPTFHEQQRARYLYDSFKALEADLVIEDLTGNILARLAGQSPGKPVVVVAHMDSVFPLDFDLSISRHNDALLGAGVGDNAVGVAALLGLMWKARQEKLSYPGDVWLVASVGEEGLGNLAGMQTVMRRFGDQVSAYIIIEGMALGQVHHRGLAVRRYRIQAETSGGHSWVDHGAPSAIHELAQLVTMLVSLSLNEEPRTSVNVGKIQGGTSVNTIAAQANLELDLRSESEHSLLLLVNRVEQIVREKNRPGVQFMIERIGERPAGGIPNDHPLVQLASSCLVQQGIEPRLNCGSTDANLPLSLGYPAICVGITTGSGAHTGREALQLSPIQQGMAQLDALIAGAFSLQPHTNELI
jgi:tripeptide aminopeptidase